MEDAFVAKLSSDGAELWVNTFGDAENHGANAKAVAVDPAGNVLVTGGFSGTVDFGGGPIVGNYVKTFLAKYSGTGAHLCSKGYINTFVREVTADPAGNVLLTGRFARLTDFGPEPLMALGTINIFVAKLAP